MCTQKVRVLLYCAHCKKAFLNLPCLVRKTSYCSLDCYWTGTNKKQERICKSCGKKFDADNTLIDKGYGFYCNRKCWFSLFSKWKKTFLCKQCNKKFLVTRSVARKNPRFCSKTCKDDFERDYIPRTCIGCNKKYELPRSELNRGRGHFCTWQCYKHYNGETSIEKRVRLELEKLKEIFVQEAKFGKFHTDFYLPFRNLVIECDGVYWHRSEKIKDRDLRKEIFLKSIGIKVIRFAEVQIKDSKFELTKFLLSS